MKSTDLISAFCRPVPFWSWNDKLEPDELRRQIGAMQDAGMGGFFMHARGGLETEYLSEELKVEVTVSPDPVNCVALGTAMSLGLNDKLETGFMDATPRIGRR